ncbi:RHS domain-containing protein [Kosakonia cowanii]
MDIFWYHTELNGVPEGVTDSNGDTAWRGTSTARGGSLREGLAARAHLLQNLRLRNQYLDRETGLHYDTFRYYHPHLGTHRRIRLVWPTG